MRSTVFASCMIMMVMVTLASATSRFCTTNADCVPLQCCTYSASQCVPVAFGPDCSETVCFAASCDASDPNCYGCGCNQSTSTCVAIPKAQLPAVPTTQPWRCKVDSDCVPNACCAGYAEMCIPAQDGPSCTNVVCPPVWCTSPIPLCAGYGCGCDVEKGTCRVAPVSGTQSPRSTFVSTPLPAPHPAPADEIKVPLWAAAVLFVSLGVSATVALACTVRWCMNRSTPGAAVRHLDAAEAGQQQLADLSQKEMSPCRRRDAVVVVPHIPLSEPQQPQPRVSIDVEPYDVPTQ